MTSRIDFHLHTTRYSPDSVITPKDLIADAAAAGLTHVVVTEHDAQWTAEDLAEINAWPEAASASLTVLSGVEVSAREGHFLCFGLPDLRNVEPGIFLKDLIAEVRGHSGAIVAAHPFRWEQEFDEIFESFGPEFQALELASKNVDKRSRKQVERILDSSPRTCASGSSDAHEPGQIGCYYTEFDAEIGSLQDFVAALSRGRFRPRHHPRLGRWQPSGPVAGREAAGRDRAGKSGRSHL